MKILFDLIMTNYSVNLDSCDAVPTESSFNPPEDPGSRILILGVSLWLSLRPLEGIIL